MARARLALDALEAEAAAWRDRCARFERAAAARAAAD
jgi:hypothetical protein